MKANREKDAEVMPADNKKLEAVLFDLDNTLILFDENEFFDHYFRIIPQSFSDIMPHELFLKKLMEATRVLLENDGRTLNVNCFMNFFAQGFENTQKEIWDRFLHFYATDYDQLQALVTLPSGLQSVFQQLASNGLKLVVATNPIFPLSVQLKRLAWAGLENVSFDLITHIENMSWCKPRIEYYLDICRKIQIRPGNCLMVGNDPVNDMIAGKTGMKTFLTVDGSDIDGSSWVLSQQFTKAAADDTPAHDHQGPLAEVAAFVNNIL
jgi:FMN phosphatase YigB (HAD superfamily)